MVVVGGASGQAQESCGGEREEKAGKQRHFLLDSFRQSFTQWESTNRGHRHSPPTRHSNLRKHELITNTVIL